MCGYNGIAWTNSSVLAVGVESFPGNWTDQAGGSSQGTNGSWFLDGNLNVTSCWSETTPQVFPCQLQYVPMILYVVIACNILKFSCMAYTAYHLWNLNESILATVGDSVASFLEHPNQTTQGRCLHDFDFPNGCRDPFVDDNDYDPVYRRRARVQLFNTTTWERWWATTLVCMAYYLSVGPVLYFVSLGHSTYKISKIFHMNSGQVDAGLILGIGGDSALHSSGTLSLPSISAGPIIDLFPVQLPGYSSILGYKMDLLHPRKTKAHSGSLSHRATNDKHTIYNSLTVTVSHSSLYWHLCTS